MSWDPHDILEGQVVVVVVVGRNMLLGQTDSLVLGKRPAHRRGAESTSTCHFKLMTPQVLVNVTRVSPRTA